MKTVFVTAGATVAFNGLIEAVLALRTVQKLVDQGFTNIVVQYGPSEDLFNQLKEQVLLHLTPTQTHGASLSITGFRFSTNVLDYVSSSDLVISHAGTGSILDALRLHKHLIVVVNENLMDNHQLEISRSLENKGHLLVSSAADETLCNVLDRAAGYEFVALPDPQSKVIAGMIAQEAGI